jgi:hypothetical protein
MRIDTRTLNDPLAALQASFDVRPAPSRRNVAEPVGPEGSTWEAMRRAVESIQRQQEGGLEDNRFESRGSINGRWRLPRAGHL